MNPAKIKEGILGKRKGGAKMDTPVLKEEDLGITMSCYFCGSTRVIKNKDKYRCLDCHKSSKNIGIQRTNIATSEKKRQVLGSAVNYMLMSAIMSGEIRKW